MMKPFYSHYDWLDDNFYQFLINLGIGHICALANTSLIVAHGDKCYQYSKRFEQAGLPLEYGVAIYLLTHISPWSTECRETKNGWVDPCEWVIANKDRFLKHLPPAMKKEQDR
ncbi:MAG: hypothetical protein WC444_04485 [Candidatus Paceibacterota bacterium]